MSRAIPRILLVAVMSCHSADEEKTLSPEPLSVEALMLNTVSDSIPQDTLPYYLDAIENIRYSEFQVIDDTLAAMLIGSAHADARYYIVSKPMTTDRFSSLVILESTIDTTFNTREHFQFVTFSSYRAIIDRCTIGELYYNENFFKSRGSISASGLISVETFLSELVDGEWREISFPIRVEQHQVDSLGNIHHVKTIKNSLEDQPVDVS